MTETTRLDQVAGPPLAGRRALITGGSRGIGAGIVRRLAADGAAVAFTYRESKGPANDLEQEIVDSGGMALAIQADSEDPGAVRSAISETVDGFDGLDTLVADEPTISHREAAVRSGLRYPTVYKWRRRWTEQGWSLEDAPRPGRKPVFSP